MAEGFAGSRSLDERRRRRLAGESTVTTDFVPFATTVPNEPRTKSRNHADQHRFDNQTDFPLARLISARKWKLITCLILLVATTFGFAVFGQSEAVRAGAYGDTVSRVFSLPNGTFFPQSCALMLIAAAQLAFSIGWVRSRNPRDFGGYYRIWRLAAGMLFVAAVCVATGLHHGLAELVAIYFPRRYPYRHVLNWLVPVSVLGFPITAKVIHDMSNCRLSTALFSLTAIAAVAVTIAPIVDQWNADESALAIAQTAVCSALLCSMLIHTWFVLHVSSEPPGQSSGLRTIEKATGKDEFDLLADLPLPESTGAVSASDPQVINDVPDEYQPTTVSTESEMSQPAPANAATNDSENGKTLRLDGSHPTGETSRRTRKAGPKSKRKSRSKRGS